MPMGQIVVVLLLGGMLLAQSSAGQATGAGQNSQTAVAAMAQTAQPPLPRGSDELTQMRDDLNRMESLNMNMSSEIEFLHDQNLQILLRTNAQMWSILIRDLRRQIESDARSRTLPEPKSQAPETKPAPR